MSKAKRVKSKSKARKAKAKVDYKATHKNRPKILNFWVTVAERKLIKKRADKYAKGSLSKWLRAAALGHAKKVA